MEMHAIQSKQASMSSGCIVVHPDITPFWGYYWHGPPPKPLEGVEVNTGGVPWRFAPSASI
jgi:hypothetical protein